MTLASLSVSSLVLAFSLTPRTALAATLVVDAGGGGDHTSIQAAVDAASTGDTIEIRAGTYVETVEVDGKSLVLQGAGSSSVSIQGDGSAAALAFDGTGSSSVSGLSLEAGERGLTVRQATVEGSGLVVQGNTTSGSGGGVGVFEGAVLSLSSCTISSNEAGEVYHGGGLAVFDSSVDLTDCVLSGNEAEEGGALYAEGSTITLVDVTVQQNTARSHGGGVRLRDASSLEATSSSLEDNSSGGRGGGVSIDDSDSSWSDCDMSRNQSDTGGGAMHLSGQASAGSSVDGTLEDNSSSGAGGAIWASSHDLTVSGELSDNISPSSENGGAIYASDLALVLQDLQISGHTASDGGGVYLASGATLTLSDVDISGNTALGSGGGVYAADRVLSSSARIEGNEAAVSGGGLYVTEGPVTLSGGRIAENVAGESGGGLLARASQVQISGSGVRDNTAPQGAGACLLGAGSADLEVSVQLSTFSGNLATGIGGGLYIDSFAAADIGDSEFSENQSGSGGGGIYALGVGQLELHELDVQHNSASTGAGIYAATMAGGEAREIELGGNVASVAGGGALFSSPGGRFDVHNLRLVENEAPVGAGLYLAVDDSGLLALSNLDLVANRGDGVWMASAPASSVVNTNVVGGTGVGIGSDSATHSGRLAYNLLYDNASAWGGELGDLTGTEGNIALDPLYASWAADGDPSGELLLLTSFSPARDAGDPGLEDLDGSRSDPGSYGGPDATDGDHDSDGSARSDGDCDDSDATVFPGASEILYDGADNDCDPETLDDDLDGDGWGHEEDCDDEDPEINPGAEDLEGDGIDQDCDGADGVAPDDTGGPGDSDDPVDGDDNDGDGWAAPEDCNDQEPSAHPGMSEICTDGFDNDCDGAVDASDADCLSDGTGSCGGCSSARRSPAAVLLWALVLCGVWPSARARKFLATPTSRPRVHYATAQRSPGGRAEGALGGARPPEEPGAPVPRSGMYGRWRPYGRSIWPPSRVGRYFWARALAHVAADGLLDDDVAAVGARDAARDVDQVLL